MEEYLTRRKFLRSSLLSGLALTEVMKSLPASAQSDTLPVVIDCQRLMGRAEQINDFLGAGGGLEGVAGNPNHPVTKAWLGIGMKHINFEDISTEDESSRRLRLSRNKNGRLIIDFTDWDRIMQSFLYNLRAQPFVGLGNVPRLLSSQPKAENYSIYMPSDLNEWSHFVASLVRHNIEKFNLRGLYYGAPGEPDYKGNWLYKPGDHTSTQLPNSVALYAFTYHGVKSADPAGRVGGPGTMNWQKTKYTDNDHTIFTLDDWLAELRRYNQSVPPRQRVGLDFITWQDYAWSSDKISESADAVSAMLARHGFNPNTPKCLAGGGGWGSWCSDYFDENLKPSMRASHLLHNIIREFKHARWSRKFDKAVYYTFFYKDEWRVPGQEGDDPNTQLVATMHVHNNGKRTLTPIYAAFQMAHSISKGTIVGSSAAPPLEAIATLDEHSVPSVVINNHTESDFNSDVVFKGIANANYTICEIQRIDEKHSNNGNGLETGIAQRVTLGRSSARISLTVPSFSSVKLKLAQNACDVTGGA